MIREIRRLSAEQSNTSLIYGEAVVIKVIRRVSPGIHPEAEMTRHLTEAGFGSIPPLLGEAVRVSPDDGTPNTLRRADTPMARSLPAAMASLNSL